MEKLLQPKPKTFLGNTKPYQFDDGSKFDLQLKSFIQEFLKSFHLSPKYISIYKRDNFDDDIIIEIDKKAYDFFSVNQKELISILIRNHFQPESYFRTENKISINTLFNN
jgi:hypothetical protein